MWESSLGISINFELCTSPVCSLSYKVLLDAFFFLLGTSVIQVTATDADDPTYGNSARVVYSILQGQPYFSVDSRTGMLFHQGTRECENQRKKSDAERIVTVAREVYLCGFKPKWSGTLQGLK